jgi:hypothetical protein
MSEAEIQIAVEAYLKTPEARPVEPGERYEFSTSIGMNSESARVW